MINKVNQWHRVELHEVIPVYDDEDEHIADIYVWWHYIYNNFFDNNKKKYNFNRHWWEVREEVPVDESEL